MTTSSAIPSNGCLNIQVTDFRELFPEFSNVSDGSIKRAWMLAKAMFGPHGKIICNSPRSYETRMTAILFVMAHIITLAQQDTNDDGTNSSGGLAGAILGAKQGSVSVSGSDPAKILGGNSGNALTGWLSKTNFGQEAWMILKTFVPPCIYRGGSSFRLQYFWV